MVRKIAFKIGKRKQRCIIVSHATLNREWHGCSPDSDIVFDLFKRANDIENGTVMLAINGHYHTNQTAITNGVLFLDINTVRNGRWVYNAPKHYDEKHTFNYEKYDDMGNKISEKTAPLSDLWQSSNTWYFEEPLFAVITVSTDGSINVQGRKTDWLYGVIPPNLPSGKMPEITSGEFKV